MLKQLNAVLIMMHLGIVASLAAQQYSDQDAIVRILTSGTLIQRYATGRQILQIPAERRTEALWIAVAHELERVAAESHSRIDALMAGREVPSLGADHSDYWQDLVRAIRQWNDPRALHPLISSAGHGMLVSEGIVRFGESAVIPLIQTIRAGHANTKSGALHALQILLQGLPTEPYHIPATALSPVSRGEILQLVRDLLQPGATAFPGPGLPSVAGLALATGDASIREQMELLASGPALVRQLTGLDDVSSILRVQGSIRYQLDRHKQ
jgi:hypothetical protein